MLKIRDWHLGFSLQADCLVVGGGAVAGLSETLCGIGQ